METISVCFLPVAGEKTYGKIGVVETIIATALSNIIFGLFSGQPLILYGATGPVLVFEKILFYVSEFYILLITYHFPF